MVRNRIRKTTLGQHGSQNMQDAVALVESGMSLRNAANQKHVNYMTLSRYVNKLKNKTEEERENVNFTPNYANRKVFSNDQEKALKEYIITCSKMSYGLDTVECRKLAYEMAVFHNLNKPKSWDDKQMAGIDWLYGFRQRNPDLTLRKPEPCSLTRATSFNRHNVNTFYDNLQEAMRRNPSFSDGTRLFCLDETGTTTVQKPKKVLAAKGTKQLNKVTSAERGTLVTTCCAVSASGSALPPAMVFPRKVYKPFMIKDAPLGTLGLAQQTGWMTGELFVEVMKHFIKVTSSSKENPSLLILDNHESHLAPAVLNIAKDNGVTLLTIPPHTSHKLQPLDVSVFGPFQTFYNAAADSWMMRNPGKTLLIYDVAGLVGQAFDKAMTPVNIKSGFKKTGIFPFDRNIFSDDDFMPSEVTNRPIEQSAPSSSVEPMRSSEASQAKKSKFPTESPTDLSTKSLEPQAGPSRLFDQEFLEPLSTDAPELGHIEMSTLQRTPSTPDKHRLTSPKLNPSDNVNVSGHSSPSLLTEITKLDKEKERQSLLKDQLSEDQFNFNIQHQTPIKDNLLVSPIACRSYPKAQPRLQSNKGRKRGRSCIATDTPVKKEFEEAALKRIKNVKPKKRNATVTDNNLKVKDRLKDNKKNKISKKPQVKKVLFDGSEDTISISSEDSSDIPLHCFKTPERNDFVIIKFSGKQHTTKHYVGKILTDIDDGSYDVSYLRKSSKVDNSFYFPLEPDLAIVGLDDIEIVLPLFEKPKKVTKRQADSYAFPKNVLKKFNLQ